MSDEDGVLDLTELEDEEEFAVKSTPASSQDVVNPTPTRYRASDTHRETLKLLSSISPSAVKVPSMVEIKRAIKELLEEGPSGLDLDDLDNIQHRLELALDTDLSSRRDLIENEVEKFKEAQRQAMKDEEPPLSQMSVEDGSRAGDEEPGTGKKRKRAGGKGGFAASLPLVLPKGVGGTGGKVRTMLVQVDDKRQHLEGDSGAVGRVHTRGGDLILDIKGHEYKAQLVRAPAMLMVSMGDEEAKVEEVFENLCLLTHHQDHLEHLGGKILKGEHFGRGGRSDDEYEYRSGSEDEGGKVKKGKAKKGAGEKKKGGGGGASKVTAGKSSKPRASKGAKRTPAKKKKAGGAKGSSAKKSPKKAARKSVSIGELKKKAKKQKDEEDDDDDDEEEEEEEDDDDSDFSG